MMLTRGSQTGSAARTPQLTAFPFVSVVVPVRNEANFIAATLDQLLAQDYPSDRFEVLVSDGQSDDTTPSIVQDYAHRHDNVRLLDNSARWSSAGRNRAIESCRGDIVVIIDGHCDLRDQGYLRHLVDAFDRSGADCVGRPQPLDVSGATPLQRAVAAARSSWLGHQPASFIYATEERFVPPQSVAIAYRREVFDACEDVEFNHRVARAGLRCFFTPRVTVHYHPRGNLLGLFRQMARYGRGRVRLCRKHPSTFSPGSFIPGALLLGLVFGPVLALHFWWLTLAYFGCVTLYALAVSVACLDIAVKTTDQAMLPWLPIVFPAIHLGAGWGIVQELVAPQPSRPVSRPVTPEQPRRQAA
jgi:succinoglycan biosynthesis protein ExoA